MTLSRWLRDYIYIPLGGSRCSTPQIYTNLVITFLLGGIWHGAGWTFIIWGALHGGACVVHKMWEKTGISLHVVLSRAITLVFINCTWIFFRATDFSSALKILKGMCGLSGIKLPRCGFEDGHIIKVLGHDIAFHKRWMIELSRSASPVLRMTIVFLLIALFAPNSQQLREKLQAKWYWVIFIIAIFLYAQPSYTHNSGDFLYFNF